jgi:hypothetical protein
MTAPSRLTADARTAIARAVAETRLAYEYSPGSYTYSAYYACLAAEAAVEALRVVLIEQGAVGEGV